MIRAAPFVLGFVILLAGFGLAADSNQQGSSSIPLREYRGRIVCLSEEMQRRFGANVPQKHVHDYGLKAEDGHYYSLLHTSSAEALLTDTNLHSRTLVIKGRLFPETQLLEVVGNLHSLKDCKLYELYYYCDVCAIKTSVPGPCMCCREPVVLREEPVK